jgi:hypothetical protein
VFSVSNRGWTRGTTGGLTLGTTPGPSILGILHPLGTIAQLLAHDLLDQFSVLFLNL